MTNQYPNPTEYTTPPITLIVTTYELTEEPKNHYFWKATTTHLFHGETIERVYQISDAHKVTDAFYKGSFEGRYNGIILKNSEFQIIQS
jgi:hypothetical protein